MARRGASGPSASANVARRLLLLLVVCPEGWIPMLQQSYHSTSAPPLQSEITATVHTWEAALVTARGGRDVDVYAAAMVPLLDALQRHTTIHALLTAYTAPD